MAQHDTGLPLESERLILRNLEERDLDEFMAYRNDPQVQELQGWEDISEQKARQYIAKQKNAVLGEIGEWVQIALEWKERGVMIGDLGFRVNGEYPQEAELGYRLAGTYQHGGFATEGAG